jgi:hypothetical protein
MKTVVSIKCSVRRFTIISIIAVTGISVSAQQDLTVSSLGTPVQSQPLQNGVEYLIQASGTYFYNGVTNENCISDSAFATGNGGGTWWYNDSLFINGGAVSWLGTSDGVNWSTDTFSPSHVYDYYTVGTGSSLEFYVADVYYPDNGGNLQVSIVSVPEPSFLLLLVAIGGGLLRLPIGKGVPSILNLMAQ